MRTLVLLAALFAPLVARADVNRATLPEVLRRVGEVAKDIDAELAGTNLPERIRGAASGAAKRLFARVSEGDG
jgi:hypothetical protein